MRRMTFHRMHRGWILDGSKTETRRIWDAGYPAPKRGDLVEATVNRFNPDASFAVIEVEKVWKETLLDTRATKGYLAEGYGDMDDFAAALWSISRHRIRERFGIQTLQGLRDHLALVEVTALRFRLKEA